MNDTIQLLTRNFGTKMFSTALHGIRSNVTGLRAMPGEISNCVTHGLGLCLSLVASIAMLSYVVLRGDNWHRLGCLAFLLTMVAVYATSTCSHGVTHSRLRNWFRKLDQGLIYLFIAGSYTPWLLCHFRFTWGIFQLSAIWTAALFGFFSKVWLAHRVTHVNLMLYVLLSWLPILQYKLIIQLVPVFGFVWLFIGGVFYMIGTIFWKLDKTRYHFHAIWHVCVMLGSACHYYAVFHYAIP